ncbi:MAG: DUF4922 domain-containing protein [Magnetococcales bacterium]|nr:DUF4922 domain-containing protein [Magnetococcales bacterium]
MTTIFHCEVAVMYDTHGMTPFNRSRFDDLWQALKGRLDEIRATGGLSAVVEALKIQQFDRGFIQDDLLDVIKYRIIRDTGECRSSFLVQYNLKRSQRQGGAGRKVPPPGTASVNGGCFLCLDNIYWQQRGIEIGYDIYPKVVGSDKKRHYIMWMNPFPLMPNHVTVATAKHIPQSWLKMAENDDPMQSGMEGIVQDFLYLVDSLPGYVGFYNGEGAGATIPHHFHFQFFKRPEGQGLFPLEAAAVATVKATSGHTNKPRLVANYPITAIYFHGTSAEIVSQVVKVTALWEQLYVDKLSLSANMIGAPDAKKSGQYHLYFIPRNKTFSRGPGMVGIIAGLELLGEIVFATEEEKRYLDQGRVDYHYVERIIASVEAPRASELWQRVQDVFP